MNRIEALEEVAAAARGCIPGILRAAHALGRNAPTAQRLCDAVAALDNLEKTP